MPVTIRDIAEVAHVSIATVSRVLTDKNHPVSEETRRRIMMAASELGYRPNNAARTLRTDRSATLGIITTDITSSFSATIVRGIQDAVTASNFLCVIINADFDLEAEKTAISYLLGRSVDGIIFAETRHRSMSEGLDLGNIPYVFAHRQFDSQRQNSVIPDELYGAGLAVKHLIGLGHRQIAYINGPEHYFASALRFQSYRAELNQAGIEFDARRVERGDWSVDSGYAAMQRLLASKADLSAVFAANDLMAVGAIYALQEAGLRVPQDVAVVGYDDREIAGIFRPALTTVTLPCYAMGEAAARMLLDLLAHKEDTADEQLIRGRLIIRESCGSVSR